MENADSGLAGIINSTGARCDARYLGNLHPVRHSSERERVRKERENRIYINVAKLISIKINNR